MLNQTYKTIEIIVVDDGSSDTSKQVIEAFLANHCNIPFVNLKENVGNTTAFNQGLALAKGKYVIDLACDDVLREDRIEKQVAFFKSQIEKVGVIYHDAQYMDESGKLLTTHFANPLRVPFEGDVYENVLKSYFIPAQTMMMKKEVLDELEGYDEMLAYEDFDFWVRSSRNWRYAFQNETLTKVRKVTGSHSSTLYNIGDDKLNSTLAICQKIKNLNQSEPEDHALLKRLKYEFKHAVLTSNRKEAKGFYEMIRLMKGIGFKDRILHLMNQFIVNWSPIRKLLVKREI